MNKKGQTVRDAILMVVVLITLAIAGMTTNYWVDAFRDKALTIDTINESAPATDAFNKTADAVAKWDYITLAILVGFAIATMILGYFIDVNGIFFFVYVLVLAVGMVLAVVVDTVWSRLASTAEFVSVATTTMPITNHILSNMAIYYTIIGVLGLLATYAKPSGGQI